MKNRSVYFYIIISLAIILIGLIVGVQIFSTRSTYTLQHDNKIAVDIFKANSHMQELADRSAALESGLQDRSVLNNPARLNNFSDSVALLTSASLNLQQSLEDLGYIKESNDIDALTNKLVSLCTNIIAAAQNTNAASMDTHLELMRQLRLSDKIHTRFISLQGTFEENLSSIFISSTALRSLLSTYNKAMVIITIIAILVIAIILIKRHSEQQELINELKAAEIAALKSKNAKDDFVANMSHELRTPLNALIGFSNLLIQTNLDHIQKEYVDVIRSGGYNLLNIVNDVLDLSKMEAGKFKIINKPFNLETVLRQLEMMFSAIIAEKKLAYEWYIDKKIPHDLMGDSDRLQQILVNLIGNSIKFTSTGGIQINTGIVWVDEESGMYKLGFTVKDTGTGIPKEKIQTIFERFEQVEHINTRQHGGTGLGLSIVKNLVEQMGGAISVYSELDVGSEFSFTCIFEKSIAPVKAEEKTDLNKISLSDYHILAAEDNKTNQKLLKHLLGRYDAELTLADNGKQAIDLLQQNEYNLVLMDIQMPVMDGYTAVSTIKKEKITDVPVIAMTAYVSESEIKKCKAAGFDDYMAKPLEEKILLTLISKYASVKPPAHKPIHSGELSYLIELVGDDPEAINEIIGEMKQQWALDKAELRTAITDNNYSEIKRILHRIKSTLSPLGPEHCTYREVADKNKSYHENDTTYNNPRDLEELIMKIDTFTSRLQNV